MDPSRTELTAQIAELTAESERLALAWSKGDLCDVATTVEIIRRTLRNVERCVKADWWHDTSAQGMRDAREDS